MKDKYRDDEIVSLIEEILSDLDRRDLSDRDKLLALCNVAVKVVCRDAPDRQTAEFWTGSMASMICARVYEAGETGLASWAKSRIQ